MFDLCHLVWICGHVEDTLKQRICEDVSGEDELKEGRAILNVGGLSPRLIRKEKRRKPSGKARCANQVCKSGVQTR